jgi:hypothetical protein
MYRKLNLIAGTLLVSAVFLFFQAVLAIGAICSIVVLSPAMLFRWSTEK